MSTPAHGEDASVARARRAGPLSIERIVEVAARITEQEGFETISMRRLADEFGVTAMALYGYVSTKGHLLELIADRYMAQLDLAEDVHDWDRRLVRIFTSFHELMVSHPILAHVFIEQAYDGPPARRVADSVLGILRDHGFSDEHAVEVFSVLASYTVGFTLNQRTRDPAGPQAAERLRRLSSQREYPNLSAVAGYYLNWPSSRAFERALEHLVQAYVR